MAERPALSVGSPTPATQAWTECFPQCTASKLQKFSRASIWGLGGRGMGPQFPALLPKTDFLDHKLFRDITVSDLWGPAGWSLRGRVQAAILWW